MGALVDKFLYRNSYVLFWKVSAAGVAAGQVADPDNVSASDSSCSGALLLPTIISASGMGITRAVYTEKDGGSIKHKVDGGIDDVTPINIVLGRHTSTLYAVMSNAGTFNVDTSGTVGTVTVGGKDYTPTTLNDVGMAIITNASHRAANGTYTSGKWSAEIFPMGTISATDPEKNQNTGENPMGDTITFTPSKHTIAPWGILFSAMSGLNQSENSVFAIDYNADYPFYIATATMDGTDVGFTLPYLPAYADVATTGRNLFTLNGVRTAITSVSITTGAVVIAAAGSASDKWQCVTPLAMPITAS